MITYNELVIDGVRTSSFPYKIIVEDSPGVILGDSKTNLLEHDGISGHIVQTNKHRRPIQKTYSIHLIKPSETQVNEFSALLSREGFWLESSLVQTTRLWCYKVESYQSDRDVFGVYTIKATFICHPTKYFRNIDTQVFTRNGVLRLQGSALAFPKITITGRASSETSFTVGSQVIRLETLSESAYMTNDPNNPSFVTAQNQLVNWSGDFITIDASGSNRTVGVVLGAGITSLTFETVWGWT